MRPLGVLLLSHRPLQLPVARSPVTLMRRRRRVASTSLRTSVSLATVPVCCWPLKGKAPPPREASTQATPQRRSMVGEDYNFLSMETAAA
uniref:Uncharacterized protein n=1 Tax=Oryza sativa subsp. japonica TaxID=39947 RepID=Q6Z033_ORYSJ|nr:hypothetical protein [Oryza sativa Japonica Group]BAD05694.1 hypothetical protein [Oryza sativa Japonica Group]